MSKQSFNCYIINNTTSPITLNGLTNGAQTPSVESGNPVVIANGNSSGGTDGNGYWIPNNNKSVLVLQASGGSYTTYPNGMPLTTYPATKGSAVYNLSDGILTIEWDIESDGFGVRPVTSDDSQWQAVVSPNGMSGSDYTVTIKSRS